MYVANISRPDILWASNTACRFLKSPNKDQWQLVQRILRYIKGTLDECIIYNGKIPPTVTAFADATWADDIDDRKSTGANLIYIGNCLVSWTCRKQKFIALSTNNAEFAALSDACKETTFIRGLLFEIAPEILKIDKPIFIYEDNEGAISQANSNILNSTNRTIAIKFHQVRNEIENRRIQLKHIPSQEQLADALTKSLQPAQHAILRGRMLGQDAEWWLKRCQKLEEDWHLFSSISTSKKANGTTETASTNPSGPQMSEAGQNKQSRNATCFAPNSQDLHVEPVQTTTSSNDTQCGAKCL